MGVVSSVLVGEFHWFRGVRGDEIAVVDLEALSSQWE